MVKKPVKTTQKASTQFEIEDAINGAPKPAASKHLITLQRCKEARKMLSALEKVLSDAPDDPKTAAYAVYGGLVLKDVSDRLGSIGATM